MEVHDVQGKKVKVPKNKKIGWRPAVYGVLIENNKLLVIKPDWDDKYSLPGGSIELKEDINEALEREFLEESGYKIKIKNPNKPYVDASLFGNKKLDLYFQRISIYFEVKLTSKKQLKNADNETVEILWKNIDEIKTTDFTYFQRNFIKKILK